MYCNEYVSYSFSRYYLDIGDELLPDDFAIVDDCLIQKASELLGYETEEDIVKGLGEAIQFDGFDENRFLASLILAQDMAKRMNGKAVLVYE